MISLAVVVVVSLCIHSCLAQIPEGARASVEAFDHRIADLRAAASSAVGGGVRIRPQLWNNLPDDGHRTTDRERLKAIASVSKGLELFWTHKLTQKASQLTTNGTSKLQAPTYESQCTEDFSELLNSPSGEKIIDAIGKPGSNILNGNVYFYGSFDECFEAGGDRIKYCTVPVAVVQLVPPPQGYKTVIGFELGICVPRSCNGADLTYYANETNLFLLTVLNDTTYYVYPTVDQVQCSDTKRTPFSNGAIVMIFVCSLFAAMAVLGTLVDLTIKFVHYIHERLNPPNYHPDGSNNGLEISKSTEKTPLLVGQTRYNNTAGGQMQVRYNAGAGGSGATPFPWEKPLEFLTAFSLFKNVSMILSTKQPPTAITSLNGIRVISMFWVILGHTYVWPATIALRVNNPQYVIENLPKRFSFQAIINAYFSVDSFFFLSGVLVCYLTLREMERRKNKLLSFPVITYYLHRYLRLTMVYAFCLFFWWFLTVHLADGIDWINSTGPGSSIDKSCSTYWWTNLLYINNFHPWKLGDECMGWTWYLANDMQFYVLAPLIIVPLFYFFPIGLIVTAVMLSGSFIANGVIAGENKFSADLFYQNPNSTSETDQQDQIYIKPYTRIQPYLVGLVLGFVLYRKIRFDFPWFVNWIFYLCVWIIGFGCCFSALYGLYDAYSGHTVLSLAENVSYFMFSRLAWGTGLACLVFACHNGYGWVINDFLSMKIWIPLSRLTYTAYLVHPIVLTVMFGSMRDTFTYTDYIVTIYAVAGVTLSYGAAGVIATFVEFPLSNLEMVVFKLLGLKLRESTRLVESEKTERAIQIESPLPQGSINDSVESGYENTVNPNSGQLQRDSSD